MRLQSAVSNWESRGRPACLTGSTEPVQALTGVHVAAERADPQLVVGGESAGRSATAGGMQVLPATVQSKIRHETDPACHRVVPNGGTGVGA